MATNNAYTLQQLKKELLNANNAYAPKTDEQIQQEAQNRFKSTYDTRRLAANQSAERNDLALANQLAGLSTSAARQTEEAQKNTRNSLSSYDRYALQRGMQRSSYNASKLANIQALGDKTLADIQQNLSNSQAGIEAQRAQLAGQLADQLAQYDISEQDDIQAYIDQLKNTEYERQRSQQQYIDKLKMALYEYGLKELKAGGAGGSYSSYYSNKSGSGSGSGSGGIGSATDNTASDSGLMEALSVANPYVMSKGTNQTAGALLPELADPGTTPGMIKFKQNQNVNTFKK